MSDSIYIEYSFKVEPLQPASDILLAELGEVGFESFVEQKDGLLAYIQKQEWSSTILDNIDILTNPDFEITYQIKEIAQENWNAVWEENFEAIQIDDKCVVRAPFHKKPEVLYDIVIEPKMSFGTGHHETTHMMLQHILENDFKNKSVLDMGCGTGVLAILAAMKGAKKIDAIDIDEWCYLNTKENIERNECNNIDVYKGDVSLISNKRYDIILANINRNILLQDISVYATCLNRNGLLFISGFYKDDLKVLNQEAEKNNLSFLRFLEENSWISAVYRFF